MWFHYCSADTINTLVDGNLRWNLGSQNLASELIHNILVSGAYRRHIETVRSKLAEAMAATSRSLATEGVRVWTEPVGGMYLWGELPQGLDAAEVARFGLRLNVLFAPGSAFSSSSRWRSFMRFNVAQCQDPRIYEVLRTCMLDIRNKY